MASIEIARQAGACYGVERALKMALEAAAAPEQPVHTLGPLIHNPSVVSDLAARGVASAETPAEAERGTLVIRAHGVTPAVIADAEERGLTVIDATCPYVKRVHRAAARLSEDGYQVVVVGECGHPEVVGILGHAGENAVVVSDAGDVALNAYAERVGVVVQTTQTAATLSAVVGALAVRVRELKVVNTICEATAERQDAAAELAGRANVMIVIGGRSSGNTRRLAEICQSRCPRTHHIEGAGEIEPSWLSGASLIGITAGASTPAEQIERTRERVEALMGA